MAENQAKGGEEEEDTHFKDVLLKKSRSDFKKATSGILKFYILLVQSACTVCIALKPWKV